MRKITLVLAVALLTAHTAMAEDVTTTPSTEVTTTAVTDLSQFCEENNRTVYQITPEDQARGTFYVDESNKLAAAGSTYSNLNGYNQYGSVAIDASELRQQFAVICYKDEMYLYNIATRLLCAINASGQVEMSDYAQAASLQTSSSAGKFLLNIGDRRITFSNGGGHYYAIRATTDNVTDDGARLQFAAVDGTTISEEDYTLALKMACASYARNLMEKYPATLVGYPAAAPRATLQAAISAAQADNYAAERTALEEAIDAYRATTDVTLPVSGKAYIIKAKFHDASTPFGYVCEQDGHLYLSTTAAEGYAGTFVCKDNGDGTFAFAHNNGKLLTYYAGSSKHGAGDSNTGFVEGYVHDGHNAYIKLTHRATQNFSQLDAATVRDEVFGSLCIQAWKSDNNESGEFYLMGGSDTHDYHNGSASLVAYGTNRSSFYYFEETEYPNTVTMNSAAGIEGTDADARIATFSAPFATVVPEGLTAYTISVDEEQATATFEPLATAGEAIPAGEGVILLGTGSNALMLPATTETEGTVSGNGNSLVASAGAAIDLTDRTNAYILGAQDGTTAFYTCTGGTLAINKAYLQLSNQLQAQAVKLRFGGVTGISTPVSTANAPLYDLSGRRVLQPAKGGIYIQNGKKFIQH